MRHRILLVGLVAAALTPAGAVAAAAAACETELPGLGVLLLEGPAELADDPRARSSIIDVLNPGAVIERRVRFSNGDPEDPLPVSLYPVAATIADGEFQAGDGRAANELTEWTSISQDQAVIPACDHIDVTVRIEVPTDAVGGERYALVVAEHTPPAAPSTVSVASRIGIRAYLQVAGDGPDRPDLVVDTIRPGRDGLGNPTVDIVVDNPGGRAVDVTGDIELTDGPGGLRAGPFPTGGGITLAPGDRGEIGITLDESLPDGPWRAQVRLRSGLLEERAEAVITFPEAGLGEPVALHPLQDRGVLLPIAVALLALALFLLLLAWRRRREPDDAADAQRPDAAGAPAGDDREPVRTP